MGKRGHGMSYIKRESLKARIEASPLFSNFGEDGYFIKDFVVELIERLPTADVVEVVHAEWVGTEYDGYADGYPVYDKWECSHCHEEFSSEGEPPIYNFCPECGAKMDGERREE